MTYMLWNKERNVWIDGEYGTLTAARRSAYRRKAIDIIVCKINGRDAEPMGIVMLKNYNKYGRTIYIQYEPLATYFLNPDGTLGQKIEG